MKKIIYIWVLFISLGCSNFLEIEPDEQISITEQLSTKVGVLQAYSGIYSDLEAEMRSSFMSYADLQGGNITFTPSLISKQLNIPTNDPDVESSYSFNDTAEESDYEGFYIALYNIINQVNILLVNIESFTFLSNTERNQLEAELVTIRAFSHYQLSLYYAQNYSYSSDASHLGVIYNTGIITAGVDFPARETMAKTYEFIQEDLDKALSLYTDEQLLSGPTYSYFNTLTTTALYAKIALQMTDWEKANTHANYVINNASVSLMLKEEYIAEWEKPQEPVSEVILEFTAPVSSDLSTSNSYAYYFSYNNGTNYDEFVATQDIRDVYEAEDIRSAMFIEANLPTIINDIEQDLPYYFTKKIQDDAGTLYIRLSEMYLIIAEAQARLDNTNEALQYLNVIRERAGLLAISSSADILEEIFNERRRELAFEGQLFFDIARFHKDVIRGDDCLANTCNLNYPSNFFLLPIPNASVNLNENMIQNEGY